MLYLHIGLHKTGSTSIQAFLTRAAPALAELGYDYPILRQTRAGHSHTRLLEHPFVPAEDTDALWRRVGEMLARNRGQRHTILSAEGFSALSDEAVRTVARRVSGQSVRIIAYVRPLDQALLSSYFQTTRHGVNRMDFDRYFAASLQQSLRGRPFDKIGRWAAVFGWDAIRVRSVDRQSLWGESLIADFLHAVGLPERAMMTLGDLDVRANVTREGWQVIELLRELFSRHPKVPHGSRKLAPETRREVNRAMRRVLEAGHTLAWPTDQARYLTVAQTQVAQGRFSDQARLITAHARDAVIHVPTHVPDGERPFLPEFRRLDPAMVMQMIDWLERRRVTSELAPLLRQAMPTQAATPHRDAASSAPAARAPLTPFHLY